MPAKTPIVDFLGDKALVLPALLDEAIVGNERAKYVSSLLQMAASYAEHPQAGGAPSPKDRPRCLLAGHELGVAQPFAGVEGGNDLWHNPKRY
jgi:hypothetical protein